jgi:hypothetical protein
MLYIKEAAVETVPLSRAKEEIREFGDEYKNAPIPEDIRRALHTAIRLLTNAQHWYTCHTTGRTS